MLPKVVPFSQFLILLMQFSLNEDESIQPLSLTLTLVLPELDELRELANNTFIMGFLFLIHDLL